MTSLSLLLPDALAIASQTAAKRLGISRTQFIRNAITHEVERLHTKMEQEAMAHSMMVMKNDPKYLNETQEITTRLNSPLPLDEDAWWTKT